MCTIDSEWCVPGLKDGDKILLMNGSISKGYSVIGPFDDLVSACKYSDGLEGDSSPHVPYHWKCHGQSNDLDAYDPHVIVIGDTRGKVRIDGVYPSKDVAEYAIRNHYAVPINKVIAMPLISPVEPRTKAMLFQALKNMAPDLEERIIPFALSFLETNLDHEAGADLLFCGEDIDDDMLFVLREHVRDYRLLKIIERVKERYLASGGFKCPMCGSDLISAAGPIERDDDGVYQPDVLCAACQANWTDVYTLADIELSEETCQGIKDWRY